MREDEHRYDDIIDRPHPVSRVHPPLPMSSRAAQFSPFAALTGYEAAVRETARLTEERVELDEEEKSRVDGCLRILQEHIREAPTARVAWFLPDERKSGGAVRTVEGPVKRVDEYARVLLMGDGTSIPFEDIYAIESELFPA